VLQIFVTLKNPLPQLGLNPWPLGPVVSTLTTTPPRQLVLYYICICIKTVMTAGGKLENHRSTYLI
jgi:hypothetical protein